MPGAQLPSLTAQNTCSRAEQAAGWMCVPSGGCQVGQASRGTTKVGRTDERRFSVSAGPTSSAFRSGGAHLRPGVEHQQGRGRGCCLGGCLCCAPLRLLRTLPHPPLQEVGLVVVRHVTCCGVPCRTRGSRQGWRHRMRVSDTQELQAGKAPAEPQEARPLSHSRTSTSAAHCQRWAWV